MKRIKFKTPRHKRIFDFFLVVIGSLMLAIGSGIFLTRLEIISGGMSGIGIIVQHCIGSSEQIVDIVVWILSISLWVLGLITLGKDFAFRTLVASICFPLFLTLILRIPFIDNLSKSLILNIEGDPTTGDYILAALFAGIIDGFGMSLTFIGGGSTGGTDVIIMLLNKYTKIKESTASLLTDLVIIIAGIVIFLVGGDSIVPSLCGIVCSMVVSVMIDLVYAGTYTSYQVDIISSKWEDISRYVQDELERGATVIKCLGAYKLEDRVILRVIISKYEYKLLREYLRQVDPKAFVTFTQTNAVYGEGFKING